MSEDRGAAQARMFLDGLDAAERLDVEGMLRDYADDAVFELPLASLEPKHQGG